MQWLDPLLRAWAQSLVGELRSHKPHGMTKKKKRNPALKNIIAILIGVK